MNNKVFSEEYDTYRRILADGQYFDPNDKLVPALRGVLGVDGPERLQASALEDLRHMIASAGNRDSDYILWQTKPTGGFATRLARKIAGSFSDKVDPYKNGKRAAVLKGLRHFYLLKTAGGHDFWLMSLPKSYRAWPTNQLDTIFSGRLESMLNETSEHFSSKEVRDLKDCTQKGLQWASKAQAMCSGCVGVGAEPIDVLVRRWFADENTTDEDIANYKTSLTQGFQRIASTVNAGKLILTDNPIDRGKKGEQYTEAYVWYDRLKVVYVEAAFFDEGGTLSGLTNWARIIVHELSHKVCQTEDWDDRYAWKGIKPNQQTFPAAKAIQCADSWAYFAADCSGELTTKNRLDALRVA